MTDDTARLLASLREDVDILRAEAEARRLIGRYMFLCDVPLPAAEVEEATRAEAIAALFTEDAVWQGVGGAHGAQFGKHIGRAEIQAHFSHFYAKRDPRQIFNTHYLCSEQLSATGPEAEGRWVQFQPWIDDAGASLLRSSRLHVRFRATGEGWKIASYRTENLFIGDLPARWWNTLVEASQLG